VRIVVSSQGDNLDAEVSPVFGRCPSLVFVDTETWAAEALPNPALSQGGGAGIQAVQFVLNHGAQAVLTGNLGPNAYQVLQAAGVPACLAPAGTVRQAVEGYKAGRLKPMDAPNVSAHAGMRRGSQAGRQAGTTSAVAVPLQDTAARESELATLRQTLKDLRQQLADSMDRINRLQKEK
jgi:predicted Fe-Mo cluster-binding NifX family protein